MGAIFKEDCAICMTEEQDMIERDCKECMRQNEYEDTKENKEVRDR